MYVYIYIHAHQNPVLSIQFPVLDSKAWFVYPCLQDSHRKSRTFGAKETSNIPDSARIRDSNVLQTPKPFLQNSPKPGNRTQVSKSESHTALSEISI